MEIEKKYIAAAAGLEMDINEYLEFKDARIEALENELKRVHATLTEISEISTKKAEHIKVIISDPNFDKPLKELNKNYE